MRVHIGSDHAGLELKNALVEHLKSSGHDVVDHGPHVYDALDDYPVFCIPAAQGVANEKGSLNIGFLVGLILRPASISSKLFIIKY